MNIKRPLLLTVLVAQTGISSAAILINGDFESPILGSPGQTYYSAAWETPHTPTTFGWTLVTGSIDHIGTYFVPASGDQSLDLNGWVPAKIYQDFKFPKAGIYRVEFDMSANPERAGLKTMKLEFGVPGQLNLLGQFSVDSATRTFTNMKWEHMTSVEFTVSNPDLTYRLQFTSTTSGPCGPTLDNIAIVAVPVAVAPAIVSQPQNQKVTIGSDVSFAVTATGTPELEYQWLFNGEPLSNANASTLTFTVSEGSAGKYSVVVRNEAGSATSAEAALQINHAPVADASATLPVAISSDNTNATVVLNGTLSSDTDGDPLQFTWFIVGQTQPLSTGVVAVVKLPLGTNQLVMSVSDGFTARNDTFTVEVITPAEAVERLVRLAQVSDVNAKPLTAILRAALASLDRSNFTSALQQLEGFQNQVRARVLPLDPELAKTFLDESQLIIDAIQGGNKSAHARIDRIWRGSDGKIRMNGPVIGGSVLIIEASEDLQQWEKIGVVTSDEVQAFNFEDANSANRSHRYYRVVAP